MDNSPPSEILTRIISILRTILTQRKEPIHADSLILTDLDLDSLQYLELVETIRETFGVDILSDPKHHENLKTPAHVASWIAEQRTKST
jgi:acyl carrier protein